MYGVFRDRNITKVHNTWIQVTEKPSLLQSWLSNVDFLLRSLFDSQPCNNDDLTMGARKKGQPLLSTKLLKSFSRGWNYLVRIRRRHWRRWSPWRNHATFPFPGEEQSQKRVCIIGQSRLRKTIWLSYLWQLATWNFSCFHIQNTQYSVHQPILRPTLASYFLTKLT